MNDVDCECEWYSWTILWVWLGWLLPLHSYAVYDKRALASFLNLSAFSLLFELFERTNRPLLSKFIADDVNAFVTTRRDWQAHSNGYVRMQSKSN